MYIDLEVNENGSYRPLMTTGIGGLKEFPDALADKFIQYNGFVTLVYDDEENITDVECNTESYQAWVSSTATAREQAEIDAEIAELKQNLANTDYITLKIAEGVASMADYADELAQRQSWREQINELEERRGE